MLHPPICDPKLGSSYDGGHCATCAQDVQKFSHPPGAAGSTDDQIDVVRKPRIKENKQAREKHVLGLLTTLRAVFPGNVTEIIARQILPYAAHDPVPDHLHLKLPVEEQRKIQRDRRQVQYDKKIKPTRKHAKAFQRR